MPDMNLAKVLKSKDRATAFTTLIDATIKAAEGSETYESFDETMTENFGAAVRQVIRLPLVGGKSDAVIDILRERIATRHDLLLYSYSAVNDELQAEQSLSFGSRDKKRKRCDEDRTAEQKMILSNIMALLHGVSMPLKKSEISLHYQSMLTSMKKIQKELVTNNATLKAKARNKSLKEGVTKLFMPSTYARVFGEVWLHVFSLDIPKETLLVLLETLHTHIIPYLSCPLVLFDFLCDAYDEGGLAGLLSLNGLFILMAHHGLEYPQFYDKLYQMLTPDVCYSRYRFTFFELVGTFLITPGLSATMVASFIKRICRLALHAPTPAVFFIISLVKLLLIKHPQTMVLIHKDTESDDHDFDEGSDQDSNCDDKQLGSDPYVCSEKLPEESKAIRSSLWELQGMLHHFNPTISATAKEFCEELRQPLGGSAPLIQARAGRTFSKMFQRELLRELKGVPTVAYAAPIPFKAPNETSRKSILNSTFTF
eukprot:TRINITY_DN13425_c0_g1_i1.p1 TRINITY_DN13425_c0_g1~~TRINITY_DN13425_c0_g1_i1.p1  ORF type:complete len:483 (+),score=73.63 TRINITY_DN13425_c0_g1_i1:52-1500(+)